MKNPFVKKTSPIDAAINAACIKLTENLTEEDSKKTLNQIDHLTQLKEENSRKRVSPDVLVMAFAGVLQVLVIVSYEHIHVIGSKALPFVKKL
jgi:hypothetical protein